MLRELSYLEPICEPLCKYTRKSPGGSKKGAVQGLGLGGKAEKLDGRRLLNEFRTWDQCRLQDGRSSGRLKTLKRHAAVHSTVLVAWARLAAGMSRPRALALFKLIT